MPFRVMHRKEVTHSNGCYERKSRGRKLADEMGRGKKIPMVLFTNPSARAGYDTRSIFKRSLTGLNSEFSYSKTSCLTKAEESSPSYYLPIAGGRIRGFIPFPRVFARK